MQASVFSLPVVVFWKTTDGTKENGGSPEILDVESIFSKEQSVLYEMKYNIQTDEPLTQRGCALLIKALAGINLLDALRRCNEGERARRQR